MNCTSKLNMEMTIMNKTELEAMNELYQDMLDETPELTSTYFQPSEEDLEAMAREMEGE